MTTKVRGAVIGQWIPDFTLLSLSGDPVSIADYLGKNVVLFCWASW